MRTDGVANEAPLVVLLKRGSRLCAASIGNVHHERTASKDWRTPSDKRGDDGGAVGEDVGVIPINVEDEGRVCGVGVKIPPVFVRLHDEARLCSKVDWRACWTPLPRWEWPAHERGDVAPRRAECGEEPTGGGRLPMCPRNAEEWRAAARGSVRDHLLQGDDRDASSPCRVELRMIWLRTRDRL